MDAKLYKVCEYENYIKAMTFSQKSLCGKAVTWMKPFPSLFLAYSRGSLALLAGRHA